VERSTGKLAYRPNGVLWLLIDIGMVWIGY
jgi:hypothetical protein